MAVERITPADGGEPRLGVRPGAALRAAWREGYSLSALRSDLLAGLVVGVVALPLSMALAIATGVRPEHGLYTAIVAGGLIALLGGSAVQVSGPTAAFVVILAPITQTWGLAGLALATSMAGVILIAMGVFRLGRLIEFIPYPVTTGFTAGIAVVIATLQVKDLLGLELRDLHVRIDGELVARMPDHYLEKVRVLWLAAQEKFGAGLSAATLGDVSVGLFTLAVLLLWPRVTRAVPAALVALPLAAVGAWACTKGISGFEAATIASKFGTAANPSGIPGALPTFVAPWNEPGPLGADGAPGRLVLSLETVRALLPAALTIALLGSIESLLSAVVADGMTGKRHDPDAELFAQGVGNVAAPFFGGFAATGAIARTATNVRSGARSPVAALTHAGFLVLALVALAPVLGYLPMASMAALLLVVARNMAEVKHVAFVLRHGPRSDVAVLATCFGLTVVFDMVMAVGVGVVLAAMLFMRRMAEVSTVRLIGGEHAAYSQPVPAGVVLYSIGGPLFFGAAQRAVSQLERHSGGVRAVVIDMQDVPTMDATGLVNLESLVSRLGARRCFVVLAGVRPQPMEVMTRAGWMFGRPYLAVAGSVGAGVEIARAWVEGEAAA